MDANGTVIISSTPKLLGMNFAFRDYFKTAKQNPNPNILQVSAPFKTVLNDFAFTLLRTIKGPNGEFAGVVVVTEVPAYFINLLDSVRHSPDVITSIAHGDGKIFLTSPLIEGLINKDLAKHGTFFTRHLESGQATTVYTGYAYATGDERIIAQSSLQLTAPKMDKPLVIGVTRKLSDVYASWTRATIILCGLFGVLVVVCVLGMLIYQKRQQLYNNLVAIQETERKRSEEEKLALEQQFQQTQKLESLGVLSGGIAHDFNNILTVIMGCCSLAKMNGKKTQDYITEIENASERAAELCRQMLAYAGKAQSVQAKVNFGSLVAEMVKMLKKTVPQNAEIKLNCSDDLPFIQGDASQLNQIIMNLIINASEAIGTEQGEIQVSLTETSLHKDQSGKDYNGKSISPGRYVCLEVTDNGCGMDEQTKLRIFEPFYTTKFSGRGLGMSAVLGIIKSHRGALQLSSQLGVGTTFKVYLPVHDIEPAKVELIQQEFQETWQGSGTILLVEDEEQVRHIAKMFLINFGFNVLEAVNGKEALELYENNAECITLVITDIGMPVMDGYALFHTLKQHNSTLPIVISSGFGEADVTERIASDKIAGIINKPYTPDKLQEMLKSIA